MKGFRSYRPTRVAFLTPTLLMGGAERWMLSLARRCDPRRIEWTGTAITAGGQASSAMCREMSAFMPVYGGESPRLRGLDDVIPCATAREAIGAAVRGADVLVTWGVWNLSRLIGHIDIPAVVFVSHGPGEWTEGAAHSSEPAATHFAAVSEVALRAFSNAARQKAVVIHNGIDVERATAVAPRQVVREQWGASQRDCLIGYVGRFSGEKNPEAVAQAAAELGGDHRAVYVGEGWMEGPLRRQVQRIVSLGA